MIKEKIINGIIAIGIKILPYVFGKITPAIREQIILFVRKLREMASKTENPYDDMIIELLFIILNIDDSELCF